MIRKILTLSILFFATTNANANGSDMLNNLNCENYISRTECINLNDQFEKMNFPKFEKMMIDNQLRKITYLLNENRDFIAKKKYDYLFELLQESNTQKDFSIINKNKKTIFNLINNYAKSNEYTKDFKYNLEGK